MPESFILNFDAATTMVQHAKFSGISLTEIIYCLKVHHTFFVRRGDCAAIWTSMPNKQTMCCLFFTDGGMAGNIYNNDGSTDMTLGD